MTSSGSRQALTRGAFLTTIALSPLVIVACGPTPLSSSQTASSGIGSWYLIRSHSGVWLLKLQIPVSYRAYTGNQFPVTLHEVGLSKSFGFGQGVHFSIVRDAGTFDCAGRVSNQAVEGSVLAFRPNETFARDEASNFGHLTEADQLRLALFDIDRTFIAAALRPGREVTVRRLIWQKMQQRWAEQGMTTAR